MASTIPAAESDLEWLLGDMLEQCAIDWTIGRMRMSVQEHNPFKVGDKSETAE